MMASSQGTNYNELAKYGISLLINNRPIEAQELFKRHLDNMQMAAGYSFATFMDALMCFEDEKLQLAMTTLRNTERQCATDIGWLKTVKRKVFGASPQNLAERLENQIILADVQVCVAILTFLQQEFTGYLKCGWVLRKAWNVYQQTYTEIVDIYKLKFGDLNLPEPTDFEWPEESPRRSTDLSDDPSSNWTIPTTQPCPSSTQNGERNEMTPETISRLMGAICFGYGLLQLGISLLPPSFLKVTNFFGFHASRNTGISNLMYARKGTDMRAPLAVLSLLWYHTIVRPFYALDGSNVKAGVEAASLLMQELEKDYGQSALFQFFKGRNHRLDSNIPLAVESFQASVNNSAQREIKLLALHEVGWCHLIQLNYAQALKVFNQLKQDSRWSRGFYAFLAIICKGSSKQPAIDSIRELNELYKNIVKQTQLDVYLQRRLRLFPCEEQTFGSTKEVYWKFFIFELLYLWNTLPSCDTNAINNIITDCNETESEPMPGLATLIQGECYNLMGNQESAIISFRNCISRRSKITSHEDVHISACAEFALALLLIKQPETKEEGKLLLQHASRYRDYDFDNKLHFRIDMILKNVS